MITLKIRRPLILGWVSFCLALTAVLAAAERSAFPIRVDAGTLASADVRSNAFFVGTELGHMSNHFWIFYWPYNWARTTTQIGSNGLFRADYRIYHRDRRSVPAKPNLSALFFRPPGFVRDPDSSDHTNAVADLDEQLEQQRRKIAGVPTFNRRAERAVWAIEQALNAAQFFTANAPLYQFSGTNNSFSFVSQLPESFPGVTESGGAMARRVRIFLVPQGRDRDELVLEHTPLLLEGYVEPYRITLARHVWWFSVRYIDGATDARTNSWTEPGTMPAQVSMTLVLLSSTGAYLSQWADRVCSLPGTAVELPFEIQASTNARPSFVTGDQKKSRVWPSRAERHAVELEWLGRSGMELARYVLAQPNQDGQSYDGLNQIWAGGTGETNSPNAHLPMQNFPLGGGTISLHITDLDRKFNINLVLLAPELMQQGLILAGAESQQALSIADALLDWLDADDLPRVAGAESDYYLGLNPPYAAKNGPIDDLSELMMIKGMTPAIFTGLTNLSTPVSGRLININTASAEVMQLIPDVDGGLAQAILLTRAGPDGIEGSEDDMPFRSIGELAGVPGMTPQYVQLFARYFGTRSTTFEVTIDVKLGRQTRQYRAWLRRNGSNVVQTLKFERTK